MKDGSRQSIDASLDTDDLDQTLPEPDEDFSQAPSIPSEAPSETEADLDHTTSSTSLVPVTALQQILAEVRKYPYLTKEEELQLFHEYHTKGDRKAAVKLILSNLRISVAIAAEYRHTGAEQIDLIQEGYVGLMHAINKFDPSKNVRFYAYAAWWVRAYILRYLLNTYRLVKVGTTQDQRKLFYNLKKEKAKLERQGFSPNTKLLADRLNVNERDVIEMDQRLGSWELSLDQPFHQDTEGTLLDVLPSGGPSIDDEISHSQLRALFRKKLAEFKTTLGERDEDILRNRILSETPLTLEVLGAKYGITKERARQLEAKIIKRLRGYLSKEFKDFDRLY